MEKTLHKVTAFVTRGEALLLFRHPQAGIQLPAGTVEEGEGPAEAVLREVAEETGLTEVEIVEKLLVEEYDLAPDRAVLLEPCNLHREPDSASPRVGEPLTRGLTVKTVEAQHGYARVCYEEYRLEGAELVLLHQQEGWLPAAFLARRIQRHFFHLTCLTETPERWSVASDRGHRFELFWVPLSTDPGLVVGQDEWLRLVRDKLR
jgi:ADP-ribose pyrophosphatase YjhB (NUDIX family)